MSDINEEKTEGQASQETVNTQDNKFTWNKTYLTICLYAVIVIFAGVLIVKGIMSWSVVAQKVNKFFSVISPFIWGAFIAFLINPLVRMFDKGVWGRLRGVKKKNKLRKFLSMFCAYLVALGLIVLMFVFVIPQLATSVVELANLIQAWYLTADEWLLGIEERFPNIDFEMINDALESYRPQILGFFTNFMTNVVPVIFTTSVSVVKVVLNSIIAVMISFYIIADKRTMRKNLKRVFYALLPEKTVKMGGEVLHESYVIFSSFVFGKAVDSLIIGLLCFIFTSIFGVPFALLISLIVGVTNMIPYFGPFIGAIPSALIVLISSPIKALVFIIIIIVLQQLDGIVIGPKILGDSVGVKPIWIIFSITVGGSIAGVIGMFLGVPVTAVILYLINRLTDYLIEKRNIDTSKL